MSTFEHERHETILEVLRDRSPRTVPELETLLEVSAATVRRDLRFLEKLGKVGRMHGGVFHPDDAKGEVSFDRKSRSALKAKLALGEAAASLVNDGETVFLDAGTTTLEVGRRLLKREGITLYTNSIPLLAERPGAGMRLIGVGGEVRSLSLALVGAVALDWLGRLQFDIAFLGASGIDPEEGPTTTELSEAAVKSAAIRRSKRVALVADASKWNLSTAVRYGYWSEIDDFFTDRHCTDPEREVFRAHGVTYHLSGK